LYPFQALFTDRCADGPRRASVVAVPPAQPQHASSAPAGANGPPEQYAPLLAAAGYERLGETPTATGARGFEARAI